MPRHPLRTPALLALIGACALLFAAAPAAARIYSIKAKRVQRGTVVFELKKLRAARIRSARLIATHHRARRLSVARIRRAARRGQLRLQLPRTWRGRPRPRTRLAIVARSAGVKTTIRSGPTGAVSSATATFGFSASAHRSHFECQLDTAAWAACSSPKSYSGLGSGGHVFAVRAIDRNGKVDPSPATRAWTVVAPAPAPGDAPPVPPPPGGSLLVEGFDAPNGTNDLVTNEYAGWHGSDSSAVRSTVWRSDGGSLFSVLGTDASGQTSRLGYTGAIDSGFADKYSQTHTHSNKMRFWTKQGGYGNVRIDADLRPMAWDPAAPSTWSGFKFYLRRQLDATESSFYTVETDILDGHVYIQKKCDGLSDTSANAVAGGTYYILAQKSGFTVPLGSWHKVGASATTNGDGSVTVSLYRNGALAAQAVDRGTGCPVLGPGHIGFRSDYLRYYLDNWTVTALQ
jgi:hypothetical protein